MDTLDKMGLRLRGGKLLKIKRCREWRIVPYEYRDALPLIRQVEGRHVTVPAMRAVLREANARITALTEQINARRPKKYALPPSLLRVAIPQGKRFGYVETEAGRVFTSFDIIDGVLDVAKEEDEEQINTEAECAEN